MTKKEHHLPSLEEVDKGIKKLLSEENWEQFEYKNDPQIFYKKLHKFFTSHLKIMPFVLLESDSKKFTFKMYRLRQVSESFNSDLISEYSYPPNHIVNSVQRANLPRHPVMYCSDSANTAVIETIKQKEVFDPNSTYALSEWKFKDDVKIRTSPFFFDNVHPESHLREFSDWAIQGLRRQMDESMTKNQVEAFVKILKYLANLFVYENTYVVSSFIAHYHLYASHSLRSDVFMYPSIQNEKRSVNFAINPNAVMEKLRLQKVVLLRFPDFTYENETFTATTLKYGENREGIIYWEDPTKNLEVAEKAKSLFVTT